MMNRKNNVRVVVCLFVFVVGIVGCSSGKKGGYRGFVPVSRAEAEAFAEQLIDKFMQGDKTPFFEFASDIDASSASGFLPGMKIYYRKHPQSKNARIWTI